VSKIDGRRKKLLTDEQMREKISDMLGGSQKSSYLTFAVFAISFLALTLIVSVPVKFRETAVTWALTCWVIHLVWTIVASFGWQTLSDEEFKQLMKEDRIRYLRLRTIWFHCWKGIFLLFVSVQLLLVGLGMLKYLELAGWLDGLVVGVYGLTGILSFWQRRRIGHVRLVGGAPDTQWGRLILRIGAIGSPVAASTCSAITILLARLHVVSKGVAAAFFGTLGVIVACVMIPQVVYDFLLAWVHLQIYGSEIG
jgi:hypothetical protein